MMEEDIKDYYVKISKEFVKAHPNLPTVLKTDLHNESHPDSVPIIPEIDPLCFEVFGVEYDQALVNIAQKKLFRPERIQRGDIRNLPYPDRMFDIIIDLSTLDHIQASEVEQALREYNRTLKPGGRLLLIVWTKTLKDPPFIDNWTPSHQSFFNQERLLKILHKYFKLLGGMETLHTLHPDRELWQFKLEKKEGIVEDD